MRLFREFIITLEPALTLLRQNPPTKNPPRLIPLAMFAPWMILFFLPLSRLL
jgi:hypothetical protein